MSTQTPAQQSLIDRIAHRMMQFRYERAKAIVAGRLLGEDGDPEELSRRQEAQAIIAIVRAFDGPPNIFAYGDAGEGERLWGLKAGDVLTEQNIADIEKLAADHNDSIGFEAEKWQEAREATLREIGGDELVKAAAAKDAAMIDAAVARAMEKFMASSSVTQRDGTR